MKKALFFICFIFAGIIAFSQPIHGDQNLVFGHDLVVNTTLSNPSYRFSLYDNVEDSLDAKKSYTISVTGAELKEFFTNYRVTNEAHPNGYSKAEVEAYIRRILSKTAVKKQ